MIILKRAKDLREFIEVNKLRNQNIGFVPTMGALHAGHLSLLAVARAQCDLTICSIFVNPTQFNDPKDFEKYPITIEQDIYLLEKADCSVLFLPSVNEIYPNGVSLATHFELGFLETILDGQYRPGHFQGVCQVMDRLLEIVQPNKLFMGQKDYQQCMVLKKLLATNFPTTQFIMCPTQRETDGLAMSSRNVRLNKEERQNAVKIFETLQFIKKNLVFGDLKVLKIKALIYLNENGFKVDYIELANSDTLELKTNWDGQEPVVALIAAFLGGVRLIDNLCITDTTNAPIIKLQRKL